MCQLSFKDDGPRWIDNTNNNKNVLHNMELLL